MSYYVFGSSLSYLDYLQARSFESSFKSEISKQTRSIIASNEELQQQQIAAIDSVSSGIEQLSFNLQELSATFQWGFSALLTAVGRVNDALTELVKIARTPAITWAYEQFEIARDAFRQGLYDEALEYLYRAVNGCSGNTGYKLEYRFHYLLGTIRMGSFQSTSRHIVNLAEAENAFLDAARYARQDHPNEAGRALLAAGWAAYCQGRMPEATQHTKQAVLLTPDLAEGHFQLGKIQMHVGDVDSALPNLERAIELDRLYSIKAAGDDDFKPYEAKVHALIDALRQRAGQKAEALFVATERQALETENWQVQEFSLPKYAELNSAKRALQDASSAARLNTLFGHLDALSFCMQARQDLQHAIAQFAKRADADANQRIAELNGRIQAVRAAGMSGGWLAVVWLGVILFFILGCQQCGRVSEANARQKQIYKAAVNRAVADLRSKGYDPNKVSVKQAEAILGRDLPPSDTGNSPSGAWFLYAVCGSALAIAVAKVGNRDRKTRAIAPLEGETARLEQIRSEIKLGLNRAGT